MNVERGKFIVFEGIDGSGKTTQAEMLVRTLQEQGYEVVLTHEPGGTEKGKAIRELILDPEVNQNPKVALCLFLADRWLHLHQVIRPALKEGKIVICDRYEGSTFAYQVFGGDLPLVLVREFNNFISEGIRPNLVIVIDLEPEEALKRKKAQQDLNLYDQLEFQKKVRQGFLWQTKLPLNEGTWVVVDGTGTPEEVHQGVVDVLRKRGII